MKIHFDFPREVLELSTEQGRGYRKLVDSKSSFERYWRGKNGVSNAYMTVYGYRGTQVPHHRRVDLQTPIVRHFVLDFDPKNFKDKGAEVQPHIPLEQTLRLHRFLIEENISHAVWFSGGGYHVWVHLANRHMPSTGGQLSALRESGMQLVNDWVKKFDLYCCDPAVPFDTSGLIRIPNSYNAKRGYWSIPLTTEDLEGGYHHILQKAMEPSHGTISYGEKGVELKVRKVTESLQVFDPNAKPLDVATVRMNDVIILPCLNQAACQVGGNPSHDARVQLVKYLAARKRNFFPVHRFSPDRLQAHADEIVEFLMSLQWADQDLGVTRYQVSTIVGKDYPQTCKSLWQKGLCIGKCRYWDKTGAIKEATSDA